MIQDMEKFRKICTRITNCLYTKNFLVPFNNELLNKIILKCSNCHGNFIKEKIHCEVESIVYRNYEIKNLLEICNILESY